MAKKRKSQQLIKCSKLAPQQQQQQQQQRIDYYEGDCLDNLLHKLGRSIEELKFSKRDLPDKIWIKQHFAIGVNEVTRVLERMDRADAGVLSVEAIDKSTGRLRTAPLVPLQAVILASDVNPRMLTKHIPNLASSRQVPVIFIKDNRGGSLRLGELVKLKTAMAIGVKARDSVVNKTIDEFLLSDSLVAETPMVQETTTVS